MRIRRDRQHAALAQQAAAPIVASLDAPEVTAAHAADAVVPRQPLVDERVVGAQELEGAPVLAQLTLEEQPGLLPEGLAQILVELGKHVHVRHGRFQVAGVEPLAEEARRERPRAGIGEHPPYFLLQDRPVLQHPRVRQIEEAVVGNAAPEQEGQPGRELDVADAIDLAGCGVPRRPLDAVEELDVGQDALEPAAHARFEVPGGAARAVEGHQLVEIPVTERAAVGAAGEAGEDLPGAGCFPRFVGRVTDEDAAAARAVRPRVGAEGAGDAQPGNAGPDATVLDARVDARVVAVAGQRQP